MITIDGISGAWNYTIGPIMIWEGPSTLDRIAGLQAPVVVVAKTIPIGELGKVDFPRVLGFVIEQGGPGDPTIMVYSNQHRATVLRAAGALAAAAPGEQVVVDGVNGKVFFDPDAETLAKYEELRRRGPPPEPPGLAQKLAKVATDFQGLNPQALKKSILDFDELGSVLDGVMAMWRKEKLSSRQVAEIKNFAKGKPVEESILGNLERYEKLQAELPPPPEPEPAPAAAQDTAPADAAAARRAAREAEVAAARAARRSGGKG